jgi:hypothetical protein
MTVQARHFRQMTYQGNGLFTDLGAADHTDLTRMGPCSARKRGLASARLRAREDCFHAVRG